MSDSITREEQYLSAIANGESIDLKPITREEQFLAKAAGQNVKMPTPITRKEMFLSKISGASGENKLNQLLAGTLTEVTAEDLEGITEIMSYAFYKSSITGVTFPNIITSIGEYAFYKCSNIRSLTIPQSVSKINEGAFQGLSNLNTVKIGGGRISFPQYGFKMTSGENAKLNELYFDDLTAWCDADIRGFYSSPTALVSSSTKVYFKNASGEYEELTSLVVPNDITVIKPFVFYNLGTRYITSIIIHNNVTTIGESSFLNCGGVRNIEVGSGVTSIGGNGLRTKSSISTVDYNSITFTFLGTTPPTLASTNALPKVEAIKKITVPKGCGEAYKTATNWVDFADLIEESAE